MTNNNRQLLFIFPTLPLTITHKIHTFLRLLSHTKYTQIHTFFAYYHTQNTHLSHTNTHKYTLFFAYLSHTKYTLIAHKYTQNTLIAHKYTQNTHLSHTNTHKYTLFYATLSHCTTLSRGTVTIRTMHAHIFIQHHVHHI